MAFGMEKEFDICYESESPDTLSERTKIRHQFESIHAEFLNASVMELTKFNELVFKLRNLHSRAQALDDQKLAREINAFLEFIHHQFDY